MCDQNYWTKKFIEEAKKIHGEKYDYSKVSYNLVSDKVKIICKEHGEFNQTVDSHLQGSGCPICKKEYNNGFSRTSWINLCNKNSNNNPMVYIIRCYNNTENFIKIGLTQNSVHRRFYGNLLPYSYEIIKEIKGSPDFIFDEEKRLHRLCKQFSYTPNIHFEGITECFTLEALQLLT